MAAGASVAAKGLSHARARTRGARSAEQLSAEQLSEEPPSGEPLSGMSVAVKSGEPLPREFYARPVVEVARELVGCVVEHRGCAGRIVETEAYHESEPACHAFVGVTPRTRTLFGEPGAAYVYRSYGIHALLNAVCEPVGVGAAVLIRALEPLVGIEEMRERRGRRQNGRAILRGRAYLREQDLCSGPGKLTQALGVELVENGTSLLAGPVVIRRGNASDGRESVIDGTRIGITKAVDLRWRFCAVDNPHVSSPRPSADLTH